MPRHRVPLEERSPSIPSGARMSEHGRPSDVLDHPRPDRLEVAGKVELGDRLRLLLSGPQLLVRLRDRHAQHDRSPPDLSTGATFAGFAVRRRAARLAGVGAGSRLLVRMPDRSGFAPAGTFCRHERLGRTGPCHRRSASSSAPTRQTGPSPTPSRHRPALRTRRLCLIKSQLVRLLPLRSYFMRTSTQLPCSFSPAMHELEIAVAQRVFAALLALGHPEAAIPQHHRAAAILALRDRAFEVAIVERMILHLDREPLVAPDRATAPSSRPRT